MKGTEVLSKPDLTDWLKRQIAQRSPAAVVRFGDGEEAVLEASLDDAESMRVATGKLHAATGLRFAPAALLDIQKAVAQAFEEADVLGILFGDKLIEEQMNRLTSLYTEAVRSGRRPAALADCALHHHILELLPEMLAGRRVSVISCRNVKPVLEAQWGLENVVVYQVPSEHMLQDVDGPYEGALHGIPIWPDVHGRLGDELTVRERGEVFLVGAGLFGKDLCIRIRERGGLALDLGSALDRIAGKITRGPARRVFLLRAQGVPVDEIAAHLEERYGAKFDQEKIERLINEAAPHWFGNPFDSGELADLLLKTHS